ncbi:MAG: pyridoxal-phosphate dependent enzyme [SAR324 cluster bacterium]|nr:pyridoxal-phosphate dependent enzyme [SAR324 cluster bacterium]
MLHPKIDDIKVAHQRIKPHIHNTPVLTSQAINGVCGSSLFFKCENFQKVGAFKIRGATNAVQLLSDDEAAKGVATHSSGNHGAALALAARTRGVKAWVVMPENSSEIKKQAVAAYGAEVILCESTLEGRELALKKVVESTGANFIHPFNDSRIIAGQGTAALELLEEIPDLDVVLAPVGGGGLISGTALTVSAISPKTKVIAAEPEEADDAYRSFQQGTLIPLTHSNTIADGLRTSLGDLTFDIIQSHVAEIITVSEKKIIEAMRLIWERMKIIVEPSAAVPLAVLLTEREIFQGLRIGLILSGGNLDLEKLPWN